MKVAVITPYYKESFETLSICHNSVVNQTHKDVNHIMVADGYPNSELFSWKDIIHFAIPNCGDYGDTPRGIGCAVASCMNYDAVCFLDADCWYEPTHIENMLLTMKEKNSLIVTCPRNLYKMDGTFFYIDHESDGVNFNDTNCYLIGKDAFSIIRFWMLKNKKDSVVGDRYFWQCVLGSGYKIARSEKATINYKTEFAAHYLYKNEVPPDNSKIMININNELKIISYENFKKLQ